MGILSFNNRGQVQKSIGIDYPVGVILPTGIPTADTPDDWLQCDGSIVTAAVHPELRAFLIAEGSPYGVSGADPLLPDMQGRMPVGRGTHSDVDTLGKNESWLIGTKQGTLAVASRTPNHVHSVPGHAHTITSHTHAFGQHQHGSPSHTHGGEAHVHSLGTHSHNISGITGGIANDGSFNAEFPPPSDFGIAFLAHNHVSTGYNCQSVDPGSLISAGTTGTGGPIVQAYGGLTDFNVAGVFTGASTDPVDPSTTANNATSSVPFQTGRYLIKAVS